ncbi:unnamed protein product [Clavelina lepadiformis]|uniref:Uncharacterized protein n=1 Tax=Clavelina lepadiformis TaxID=159417 RepID=A0ABP0GX24_CLALP
MNWSRFCAGVLLNGGSKVDYAYVGSRDRMWGDSRKLGHFTRLSIREVITIRDANGADFVLRGEEYLFVELINCVHNYEGTTRSIAYGITPNLILVVSGCVGSYDECRRAIEYGLPYITNTDVERFVYRPI